MNFKAVQDLLKIIRELKSADDSVFLVGGAVRDHLLGLTIRDLDFVVSGDSILLARKVAKKIKGVFFILDPARHTARVICKNSESSSLTLDFALMQGTSIKEDLIKRDFTINAIAMNIENLALLIDPLKGEIALKERRIILCSPESIIHDPLRILRAIRLKIQFDLTIDSDLEKEIKNAARLLERISPERIRDELFLMMDNSSFHIALELMVQLKIYEIVFPTLGGIAAVNKQEYSRIFKHTLLTIETLYAIRSEILKANTLNRNEDKGPRPFFKEILVYKKNLRSHFEKSITEGRNRYGLLILAAIFHDAGALLCKAVDWDGAFHYYRHEYWGSFVAESSAKRFVLSKAESQYLSSIIVNHTKPLLLSLPSKEIDPREIYRYFFLTKESGIDTAILSLAENHTGDALCEKSLAINHTINNILGLFDAWWNKKKRIINPPQLVNGNQLMQKFKLSPGPQVGVLLAALKEEQAAGIVKTQADAYRFLRKMIEMDSHSKING